MSEIKWKESPYKGDWEPSYSNGPGVYATLQDPPKYVYVGFHETGEQFVRSTTYESREDAEKAFQEFNERIDKFWTDRLSELSDPNIFIIDGHFWSRGKNGSGGMGGRFFAAKRWSDNVTYEGNSWWYGGQIPEKFLPQFPNNAHWVNGESWQEVGNGTKAFG
jgi:hypothetical protein